MRLVHMYSTVKKLAWIIAEEFACWLSTHAETIKLSKVGLLREGTICVHTHVYIHA